MTYYEHAILIAYRLGPWADDVGSRRPKAGYEIEEELARARLMADATPPRRGFGGTAGVWRALASLAHRAGKALRRGMRQKRLARESPP